MATRNIAKFYNRKDIWRFEQTTCVDPMHEVPNMMVVYKEYVHKCPSCGQETTVYPNTVRL